MVEKLNAIGFNQIKEQQIISPGIICRKYLESHNLRPHLLIAPSLLDDFKGINRENPNCVVIGDAGHKFSYENLNEILNLLVSIKNPVLISMGANKYYQSFGKLFLDCGSYASLLGKNLI